MKPRRRLGCLVVVGMLVVLLAVGWALLRRGTEATLVPEPERCVATAAGRSVAVELDQAHFASLIAAVAVERGLPARAVSIALATAYQESGIRNLDYGDRDSVGLFQQRPSQGWGSSAQLQQPRYASNAFYDALVKVPGWQTGDINDVAQTVQRSAYPEAYRDHEADGRTLASVLTGHSPRGLRCLQRTDHAADPAGFARLGHRYLGARFRTADGAVTVRAGSSRLAWAYAHFAVANAAEYGVSSVTVGGRVWTSDPQRLAGWTEVDPTPGSATPPSGRTVVVTFGG